MKAKNKFSSKPKVLTFDYALKIAQPVESDQSAGARYGAHQYDHVDIAQNTNINIRKNDRELPVYKGMSLYRHNSDNTRKDNTQSLPNTIFYGGKSTDYDLWREGNTTYVRHKVGKLFEDALVRKENIRFNDRFFRHNDPSIGSKPPIGRVKRVSQEYIKKHISQKEFFNFNQNKNVEYDYVYDDITKKIDRQKNIEISDDKQESIIRNLTATGDFKSLSATYIEAGNILDYIQWKKKEGSSQV